MQSSLVMIPNLIGAANNTRHALDHISFKFQTHIATANRVDCGCPQLNNMLATRTDSQFRHSCDTWCNLQH